CHQEFLREAPAPLKSLNSYDPTYISFINKSSRNAEAWWLNFAGKPVSYGDIQPRKSLKMNTFLTHPWIFRASDGAKLMANLSEVYFPTPAQFEEYGYPRYQPVYVTVLNINYMHFSSQRLPMPTSGPCITSYNRVMTHGTPLFLLHFILMTGKKNVSPETISATTQEHHSARIQE
uniref:von Hippel-Lindau disease tumour suppressor beta domain-containing protein n=1 Tax=Cyprinus carpio carpio TaxID=630221 RepID=A0A8C1CM31_CYPCA